MGNRRLALITGASAGIGEQFARVLARRGFDLALVARRRDKLEALAVALREEHGCEVLVIAQDLSDKSAAQKVVQAVNDSERTVDVLVNNAGYGMLRGFSRTEWNDHESFFQVLVVGQIELMHLVLPGMRKRGYGRVINVASLAIYAPAQPGSLYAAVKQMLVAASRAIALEYHGTGVHITASCPGYTLTEFHDVLGNRLTMNKLPGVFWQTAEAVAEESWRACERNKPLVITGRINRIMRLACAVIPNALLPAFYKSGRGKKKPTRR